MHTKQIDRPVQETPMTKDVLINEILKKMHGKTYLEIGLWMGGNFKKINARRKFGVDPTLRIPRIKRLRRALVQKLKFGQENIFELTSDDFFKQKSELFNRYKIDVVLIDGLHTYGQSLKDALNTLDHLSDNGVIVMHDCNPTSQAAACPTSSIEEAKKCLPPDWNGEWNGDVWKTIVHLRSSRNDLKVFVLDCDSGVGIVTRGTPENTLACSIEEIQKMSYNDLAHNRKELLNLKTPDYFYTFLDSLA